MANAQIRSRANNVTEALACSTVELIKLPCEDSFMLVMSRNLDISHTLGFKVILFA